MTNNMHHTYIHNNLFRSMFHYP